MKHIYLILFIIFYGGISVAQNSELLKKFESKIYISPMGERLLFRILSPNDDLTNKKYPLVIFLHGAGERGGDNKAQLTHGAKLFADSIAKYPCYVVAPQCPTGLRWTEVDWTMDSHKQPKEPSVSLRLTMEVIEFVKKEYNIDESRIYITGLSMGGFGTWDAICRYPKTFAAAIPVCGGADVTLASLIKQTPIWAFHGATDRVVKVSRSRNMVAAIRKENGKPKYTEYPNTGHLCWNKAYSEKNLLQWLFSKSLK